MVASLKSMASSIKSPSGRSASCGAPSKVNAPTKQEGDSPHFMAPTLASKRAESDKYSSRSQTPVGVKVSKPESSNPFLKSAAKRVGFGRGEDCTPRSRKENLAGEHRAISFPDNVCLIVPVKANKH